MTYAVAVKLDRGLVFAADTRTNAGVDNIAQYKKLTCWCRPGDRVLVLMTAGNLAVSQAVLSLLTEQINNPEYVGDTLYPLLTVSEITPQRTTGVLGLTSTIHNQDGVLVMDGLQRYLLRKRPPT